LAFIPGFTTFTILRLIVDIDGMIGAPFNWSMFLRGEFFFVDLRQAMPERRVRLMPCGEEPVSPRRPGEGAHGAG
jgi:hypothetical protein